MVRFKSVARSQSPIGTSELRSAIVTSILRLPSVAFDKSWKLTALRVVSNFLLVVKRNPHSAVQNAARSPMPAHPPVEAVIARISGMTFFFCWTDFISRKTSREARDSAWLS